MLADRALAVLTRYYNYFLSFALMLAFYGVLGIVGVHILAGGAVFTDVSYLLAMFFLLLIFSLALVFVGATISEVLGHHTYISPEEGVKRVWIITFLLFLGSVLYFVLPPMPRLIFTVIYFIPALLASVAIAVDGVGIREAVYRSFEIIRNRTLEVLEFLVLVLISYMLLAAIELLDNVGPILAIVLQYFLFVPWAVAFLLLLYLYRYPLVVSRVERLKLL